MCFCFWCCCCCCCCCCCHNKFHRSAYHTGQSIESVFLLVHQDIAEALDNKCMTASVLLDLSAGFDVIDHVILQINRESCCRMTRRALSWVQSHISNIIHGVTVRTSTSESKCLKVGVLQGSVLGPRQYFYDHNKNIYLLKRLY